jgi:signal transduction histidine kinase
VLINLIGNAIKFSHTNTEVSIHLNLQAEASTKTKYPKNFSLAMHSKVA